MSLLSNLSKIIHYSEVIFAKLYDQRTRVPKRQQKKKSVNQKSDVIVIESTPYKHGFQ